MLYVDLLGTGGMMPLPNRYLTSLMIRYEGEAILVDCGEGTQVSIREKGLGFKHISTICITHFHADHISGLPGLLLTIGNSDRTNPVTIIGPKRIKEIVKGLLVIAPYLPFEIKFIETTGKDNIYQIDDLKISSVEVEHDIFCLGYKFELGRAGKFDLEHAKKSNLPVKYWSKLQAGKNIEYEDKKYNSLDFMGEKRKGLKVVYSTDLRPSEEMVNFAKNADLFICEGIYADDSKIDKALSYKHTMFSESATMAKKAKVKELWLTHFSPSLVRPEDFLHIATNIFKNTYINKLKTELNFDDE